MKRYWYYFLIAFAFLLLPTLLFWDVTLGGKTMLPVDNLFQWQPYAAYAAQFGVEIPQNGLLSDLIIQNYVWKSFTIESLRNGELPLWSPDIFAGAPFLANGQHSMLYPFSLLFAIMPVWLAYGWFTISQLWIAGVGGYIFGRSLMQSRPAAALVGLIFQGCGFMLVSAAVFPMIIAAAAWLPIFLAAIERIIRASRDQSQGNTLPWSILGASALGLNILAGHPEITYYVLLIGALFAGWRLLVFTAHQSPFATRHFIKPAVWLLTTVAIGLMLGAIQLIPAFELAGTNFREGGATLTEIRGWAFPLRRVLTLVMPNFFGNPSHHTVTNIFTGEVVPMTLNAFGNVNPRGVNTTVWGLKNYVEGGIYLGVLPLILAGIGIFSFPKQEGKSRLSAFLLHPASFFVFLAIIALNFIFGSPLYAVLYRLPFINQLHSPFRWVFALAISVAVLAGYGFDAVSSSKNLISKLVAYGSLVSGLLFTLATFASRPFYPQIASTVERLFMGLAAAPDAFPNAELFYSYLYPKMLLFGVLLFVSGMLLVALFTVFGDSQKKRSENMGNSVPAPTNHAAIAGTTSVKSKIFVAVVFGFITVDLLLANRGFHAANDPALLAFKPEMVQWLEAQAGDWRLTTFAPKDKAFNSNLGWLNGFADVRGYDSIINRQYVDFMAAIDTQDELEFNRIAPLKNWEAINSPLLDLLGVKYIITSETLNLPKLIEVWQGEGVRIYENAAVMARAYTIAHEAALFTDDALAMVAERDPRGTLLIEGRNLEYPTAGRAIGSPQPANILQSSNLEVTVDTTVTQPSWLVLNDSWAQGWRAFISADGGETETQLPIEKVNGNFRAVFIAEAGDYQVRFRYSPRSFIIGGLTSFMGGIIIAFAAAVWGWRRFYRREGELTNTQSIAKNSVVPMALSLFNKAIDFGFAAFYLRVLGPGESGAYATAISIALWFDIVANWGLDALIIRDGAQNKAEIGRYLLNTTLLRIVTMILGLLPVFAFLLAGEPLESDVLWALALIAIGMVFSGIGKGLTGVFYVFESAEYPATLTTVTTILKVFFGVFVLLIGWGFIGLAGVSILTNVITLALLAFVAFRKFPLNGPWTIDFGLQKRAFFVGYPLMLNHLLATVFFKIDQPLLYRLDSEQAVGWYNSAYKWVDGFNVIPSFFTFALFPIISRQVIANLDDARRTFRMAVKLLVLTALPLAATVTLLADIMIELVGGAAFLPHGAISLRLVIWSIPIGWINSVTNYMIVSLKLERRLTRGFIVGVLFNTIGNILFIPRYGYVAAAVTTILSELILLVMFNFYLQQKMQGVQWFELLWRPIVVTAVSLGAMLLLVQFNLVVALIVGWGIYAAGLWVLRVFGAEERRILQTILPTRFHALIGGD